MPATLTVWCTVSPNRNLAKRYSEQSWRKYHAGKLGLIDMYTGADIDADIASRSTRPQPHSLVDVLATKVCEPNELTQKSTLLRP